MSSKATTQKYDKVLLKEALSATAEHRGSTERIADTSTIAESDDLLDMWKKYQKKFIYAKDISYEDIIGVIRDLLEIYAGKNVCLKL
jgi:hypothetical protein